MFLRKIRPEKLSQGQKQAVINELENRIKLDQELLKEAKKIKTQQEMRTFLDKAEFRYEK